MSTSTNPWSTVIVAVFRIRICHSTLIGGISKFLSQCSLGFVMARDKLTKKSRRGINQTCVVWCHDIECFFSNQLAGERRCVCVCAVGAKDVTRYFVTRRRIHFSVDNRPNLISFEIFACDGRHGYCRFVEDTNH